ncbi:hypothetical protein [Spectribacter hydrogenoxidans]|uniref:Uncharacterized protein n=1 Tax=Spectribacter hydrogenoxidans TaxID=3075608 RepID=A0ABU3C232_9GAMM|nr:hypothetical protein [Salinisphaera sp. W335]MDT0635611.1 hypothetical protein [Salinisphaera sp. W335]
MNVGRVAGRTGFAFALLLLGLVLATARAETRLESPGFGNIDELRMSHMYPALDTLVVGDAVVPGLHENFVPQGIDFLDEHPGEVVLSGYFCKRFSRFPQSFVPRCVQKRSALYLVDATAGRALRLALLSERDGTPMRRHAGGVASLYGHLWLPDNFVIFRFDLNALRDAEEPVITMTPDNDRPIAVDASGDFISAFEDSLWVGNFQRADRGRPLPPHYLSPLSGTAGWTAGYRMDPQTLRPVSRERYEVSFAGQRYEVLRPDAALHHRNKAQGMGFIDARNVVLSASYGPSNSRLSFHALECDPFRAEECGIPVTLPDDSTLHVQALAEQSLSTALAAPPGAEGVAFDGERLTVVFEGGAMPYRRRWWLVEDRLLLFLPPPESSAPPLRAR